MKTHAYLTIKGQVFQIRLSIEGMTSYWAVSVSDKLRDCQHIVDQRFKAIGCDFCLDLQKFFEEESSLIFAGNVNAPVEKQRLISAMEATVTYLAKKLGLEIMKVDFVSK